MSDERKIVFNTFEISRLYTGPETLLNVRRKMNAVEPGLNVKETKTEFQKKLEEEEENDKENNPNKNQSQTENKNAEIDKEKKQDTDFGELEFITYNRFGKIEGEPNSTKKPEEKRPTITRHINQNV